MAAPPDSVRKESFQSDDYNCTERQLSLEFNTDQLKGPDEQEGDGAG